MAAAINAANVGVRAAVIATDTGRVLQMTAATTGTNAAFTAGGFVSTAQTVAASFRVGTTTLRTGPEAVCGSGAVRDTNV